MSGHVIYLCMYFLGLIVALLLLTVRGFPMAHYVLLLECGVVNLVMAGRLRGGQALRSVCVGRFDSS